MNRFNRISALLALSRRRTERRSAEEDAAWSSTGWDSDTAPGRLRWLRASRLLSEQCRLHERLLRAAAEADTLERTWPTLVHDVCSDCWYEARPDQYFPDAMRYGTCDHCGQYGLVVRTRVECIQSPTFEHEPSETMCATCLEYDPDWDAVCPSSDDGSPHTTSDALCVWCLEYDA